MLQPQRATFTSAGPTFVEWAKALLTDHVILTRYLTSQDAISGTKTHRQEA
jgi:hypothetical protein